MANRIVEFRSLTCVRCANRAEVIVLRVEGRPDQFGGCQVCGTEEWLNVPVLDEPDLRECQRLFREGRATWTEGYRRRMQREWDQSLDRDPDSPERQPWWFDGD